MYGKYALIALLFKYISLNNILRHEHRAIKCDEMFKWCKQYEHNSKHEPSHKMDVYKPRGMHLLFH